MVTGMEVISAIGTDLWTFSENVFSGVSGVDWLSDEELCKYPGAEVKGYLVDGDKSRSVDFALSAFSSALRDAKLEEEELNKEKTAVVLGGGPSLSGRKEIYYALYEVYEGRENKNRHWGEYHKLTCGYHPAATIAQGQNLSVLLRPFQMPVHPVQ